MTEPALHHIPEITEEFRKARARLRPAQGEAKKKAKRKGSKP
jgi:hypothetical protein